MKLKHATLILLWLSAAAVVVFAATPTKPSSETAASGKESAGPARSFPKSAFEYAKMAEPELGVPPKIDLSESVEIPLYVNGVQKYGNLGRSCDNYTLLGKDTVSGSVLQRYEGRTADGQPLPDVVWVSFARNSSHSHDKVVGSVQMIGYNKKTGATAFFESCDQIGPWVSLDEGTLRMRGVMPWIDNATEFDKAFRPPPPGAPQCVQCHQADPFITNSFINAAKIPGTNESVVPILDRDSPYFVIGGDDWDMRTIHIEGNKCFECHRVGMSTVEMFTSNGWDPNKHMPPHDPGSLAKDFEQLLEAWQKGPTFVKGAHWVIPPAKGIERQVVGEDYPNKEPFNAPRRKDASPSQATLDETVKVYCAAWSEPDADRRRELLGRVWDADGIYTDPLFHIEGREALIELMGGFLQTNPSAQIVPSSHVDFHHGTLRFSWKFIGGDSKTVMEGIDFGVVGEDGKLKKIVGFFGSIKPLEPVGRIK